MDIVRDMATAHEGQAPASLPRIGPALVAGSLTLPKLISAINMPSQIIGPLLFPDLSAMGTSGIYFLHCGGQVVYVGQAKLIRQRIAQHIAEGRKNFDAVSFIACAVDQLDALERRYIKLLLPHYNQCYLAKRSREPLKIKGATIVQPTIGAEEITDDAGAARYLGISVEELREHQRLGHGPHSVRRPRSKERRYPLAVLRKFAARHLCDGEHIRNG